MKKLLPLEIAGLSLLSSFATAGMQTLHRGEMPNILWITSEDNSPFLKCYGDPMATTPHLDKLASEGFLYTHAYANAPVCAPARNTIITGVYACSGGNQPMRSDYRKSEIIRYFPQFLREKGYYCTNSSKEDYNIDASQTKNIWDESGKHAHYRNRKAGQPFFAIFNSTISHESCIHKSVPDGKLRHDPKQVKLPPYHPDTPEMRHDWAQYYDKVEDMDSWVGSVLKELEENGEAENTIVFYYADNGGVLGRSKRFVYETGTRVPFIIRIPEKYRYLFPAPQPGSRVDRLISFADLAPSLLSIAGVPVPAWMQGQPFLGDQKKPDPRYAFMFRDRMDERIDMVRAVRDQRFRYIRNYMPYRIHGQHINYLWQAPSMQSWEKACLDGKCNEIQSAFWKTKPSEELYDTENDPWEVNNLAEDPAYRETLERMSQACDDWLLEIKDTGFIPEGERGIKAGGMPLYDYMRNSSVPLGKILETARLALQGKKENLEKMTAHLRHEDSAVRYWAAAGLLILKDDASPAIPQLREALNDLSPDVAIVAAEALYDLGEKTASIDALVKALEEDEVFVRVHALNVIDHTDEESKIIKQAVARMVNDRKNETRQRYDLRLVEWLAAKWAMDLSSVKYT